MPPTRLGALAAQLRSTPVLLPALRHLSSSSSSSSSVVSLDYDRFSPKSPSAAVPLVILHGLYGSRQNWRSLARNLATSLDRDVYPLDLRNHGQSPHARECDYSHMADDVRHFIQQKSLGSVALLGHSM